eukprot:m.56842 g.56842  ORF g.56842 m.56842 type:complete len:358 (-) comp13035_c1_seq3:300-1373(-)
MDVVPDSEQTVPVQDQTVVDLKDGEDDNQLASSSDSDDKRPRFGSRYLQAQADVFAFNAWDDVQSTPEQEEEAQRLVQYHREHPVPAEEIEQYNRDPGAYWEKFYSTHENKFFKDRRWLFTEFPELMRPCDEWPTADQEPHVLSTKQTSSPFNSERWEASKSSRVRVLEVGCGAGNTVFPLVDNNPDNAFFVYACDYAPTAVELVKGHEKYNADRCHAFVCNIATDEIGLPDESLDAIILIFVLSALHPDEMAAAVTKLVKCLKPGGALILRDYGRHDLAQLRLKKGRYLQENFYIRGDGTRVYFYEQDEVRRLMEEHGLMEEQNKFDRRLIVNRAKRVTMQRVWLQCKYRKPMHEQ